MTSAQVVETSVTNNSSFQNYPHPDDHTIRIEYINTLFNSPHIFTLLPPPCCIDDDDDDYDDDDDDDDDDDYHYVYTIR